MSGEGPIQIEMVISPGELDLDDAKESTDVCDAAGYVLDAANSSEITGVVLFLGKDGEVYCGTVEFVIAKAQPEFALQEIDAWLATSEDELDELRGKPRKALQKKIARVWLVRKKLAAQVALMKAVREG